MTLKFLTLAVVISLAACSTTKPSPSIDGGQITAINAQKLTTNFKRKGVKIEWECAWGTGMLGLSESMCIKGAIKAVEVTAYATSNGNSENNRETAFKVAEMKAKGKLRQFIKEDVNSSSVQHAMAKNVEKANDRIKNRIKTDEDVEMSEEEAAKDTNFAIRENSNDTVRTLTENIRTEASGILRGIQVHEEAVVDRQTVSVTLRWDKESESAAAYFNKKFR
jgi:hypothetical protein